MAIQDLVYDVGVNNGDDTAHYLERGYRVVGVEADPTLADKAKQRFGAEVAAGRLHVLNVAVAEEDGARTFYVSEETQLSSFDRENATKFGKGCRPLDVQCRRFEGILAEFGVPHYLKVDIEGHDHLCLRALREDDPPDYVSVELCSLDDFLVLARLGYNAFKLIRQDDFTPLRAEEFSSTRALLKSKLEGRPGLRRLFSALALAKKPLAALRGLAAARPAAGPEGAARRHPPGSSGPFAEETPGAWQALDDVLFDWLSFRRLGYHHYGHGLLWFDIHATKKSPAPPCKLPRVRSGAVLFNDGPAELLGEVAVAEHGVGGDDPPP